jgi:UDP-N-acetylenolpyruvoylglucosamine reductase
MYYMYAQNDHYTMWIYCINGRRLRVIGEGSNGSIMDLGTDVMVVKSERGNNGSIVLEYASKQKVTFAFKKWAKIGPGLMKLWDFKYDKVS